MTKKQIDGLVKKYYVGDGYQFPRVYVEGAVENRVDFESGKILYSLIRHYQPTIGLDFGGSRGFSSSVAISAMLKNGKKFFFTIAEKEEELVGEMRDIHKNIFPHFQPTYLGDIIDNLDKIPNVLNYAFIDTNHDEDLTYWYLRNIFPRFQRGSLVAIHDWSIMQKGSEILTKKAGILPETKILFALYCADALHLKKLYWTFENYSELDESCRPETSFWLAEGGGKR